MTGRPEVPLEGSTLLVGPSGVGKTQTTAAALASWVERNGSEGVVVLDFGPEITTDDGIVGGRLTRFIELPAGVWYGTIDAHGPRLEGGAPAEVNRLARLNATRALDLLKEAPPHPRAVFVNDATIALQADADDAEELIAYCRRADYVVVNAYQGTEFGDGDAVSRQEREAIATLRAWARCVIELPVDSAN